MTRETVDSLCQKAQRAMAQGKNELARALYLQALGLRSDLPSVHYGLATVCFLLKDLTSAAFHFKEVTRLDPLRAGAFINLGAVYNRLDQLDDAIAALRRGIQLDHNRAEGFYNLGLVYKRKGQTDLAIQAYREALRINPKMYDAHYNLGNLYFEQGEAQLALDHYRSALELRPEWEKAMNGIAQAEAALQGKSLPAEEAAQEPTGRTHDPERMVDPDKHGAQLSRMHEATIESEGHGRDLMELIQKEVEPALKELSTCLLQPGITTSRLSDCVQKMEAALANILNTQQNLQNSMERVQTTAARLLES